MRTRKNNIAIGTAMALLVNPLNYCASGESWPDNKAVICSDRSACLEKEIESLLKIVRSSNRYREDELALHRLVELEPTGKSVLPVAICWLKSSSWQEVRRGRSVLMFYQEKSIPYLLAVMEDRKCVKLVGTADLIYPGADTFYGHGNIVDYDIDYLPARAGWILEELAFQDFGFQLGMIDEDILHQATEQGNRDVPLNTILQIRRSNLQSIDDSTRRARDWWKSSKASWTRLEGILDAVESKNTERQVGALVYIRLGTEPCRGLTSDVYQERIRPVIQPMVDSSDADVREHARLLLDDDEQWWWKWKDKKHLSELLSDVYSARS